MADLLQTARLFEVGTRLQTAASNLMSVAQGGAPDSSALRWAGDFLLRVDWTSGAAAKAGIDGGLAVSATNARPKFYASLVRIGPKFREVGIDSEEQIYSFLKAVYRFLQSGGSGTKDSPPERLKLAGEFLHMLSQSIMVDLSNNGLPKRKPVLTLGEFVA
jgi:hypothetical protein